MTAAAFHLPARHLSLLEFVRPFLLLAVLAFLAGFGGYLILGPPNVMSLTPATHTAAALASPVLPASAPATTWADNSNAPRHI